MLLVRLSILIRKGKELKAPYYASTTAIYNYIIIRTDTGQKSLRLSDFTPKLTIFAA